MFGMGKGGKGGGIGKKLKESSPFGKQQAMGKAALAKKAKGKAKRP